MKSLILGLALLSSIGFTTSALAYDIDRITGEIQVSIDPTSLTTTSSQVDVLFVVDNSGSMGIHQGTLSARVNSLLNPIRGLDVNAGVISTDVVSPEKGVIKWVNTLNSNWQSNLASMLMLGTYGAGTEQPLDSIASSISQVNSVLNDGFFRPTSDLVVIFLTDADDQSVITTTDFLTQITAFKGDLSHVVTHGIIIPTGAIQTNDCMRDTQNTPPIRLEEVIAATNGVTISLCDQDWTPGLEKIAEDIKNRATPGTVSTSSFILPLKADAKTIKVTYGSTTLVGGDTEFGWIYEAASKKLVFGSKIDWSLEPTGTKLVINFVPATWN